MSCGSGHYKHLMAQFGTVVEVFLSLEESYQEVIADITRRMGEGMADFIQREVGGLVGTVWSWRWATVCGVSSSSSRSSSDGSSGSGGRRRKAGQPEQHHWQLVPAVGRSMAGSGRVHSGSLV